MTKTVAVDVLACGQPDPSDINSVFNDPSWKTVLVSNFYGTGTSTTGDASLMGEGLEFESVAGGYTSSILPNCLKLGTGQADGRGACNEGRFSIMVNLPFDWKQGTTVYPFVDWMQNVAVATAETIGFYCHQRVIKRGVAYGAKVTTTCHSSGSGVLGGTGITALPRALFTARFPEIAAATGCKVGDYIQLTFDRFVPGVYATSAVAEVAVLGAGLLYKANDRSGAEYSFSQITANQSAKATA